MILLTAASGPTGQAVLKHLAKRGARVRALARSAPSEDLLRRAGAAEVVLGDLNDAAVIRKAVSGCDAVYFICPGLWDNEPAIGQSLLTAALAEKVRLFAYHSAIHPQIDELLHHRDKRRVEAMAIEAPIASIILNPSQYMTSNLRDLETTMKSGKIARPHATDKRLAQVDLDDVGEAAAIVLTETGWTGGCFELSSGESYSLDEMAALVSEVTGRTIVAEREPVERWLERMQHLRAMSAVQIQRAERMFSHYSECGLPGGNGKVLELILGRKPAGYRAFLQRMKAALEEQAS